MCHCDCRRVNIVFAKTDLLICKQDPAPPLSVRFCAYPPLYAARQFAVPTYPRVDTESCINLPCTPFPLFGGYIVLHQDKMTRHNIPHAKRLGVSVSLMRFDFIRRSRILFVNVRKKKYIYIP